MGKPTLRARSLEDQATDFLARHGFSLPVLDARKPSQNRGRSVTAIPRGLASDLDRLVSGVAGG